MKKPWLKFYDEGVPENLDYPLIPVYKLLDQAAEKFHHRPATWFYGKERTYGQIKELSDRLAAALQKVGIEPGDGVALLLPNSPQFIICYFGILKAGAVAVPLNPLSSQNELRVQMAASGCKVVITLPMFLENVLAIQDQTAVKYVIFTRLADEMGFLPAFVQGIRESIQLKRAYNRHNVSLLNLKDLLKRSIPENFQPVPVDPHILAVLIYSGGTTGSAKGIMLSHEALVVNACQVFAWGHLGQEDRLVSVLPFFHGYGLSVNLNAGVMTGGEFFLIPRFKLKEVAGMISRHKPTFFTGVPTMFAAFNRLPDIQRFDFTSLKAVIVGAAPLPQAIKDTFESRIEGHMIEGYGLTESVSAICANPLYGLNKTGSIGIPFPNVEMKVVSLDNHHRDLLPGETGEIILRGPIIMMGYHRQPEQTQQTIIDGWLYTGDIGCMDEDGYFYITDRKKDLIIVGGFNVFPREIDELICAHPKVNEGIVVGLPDEYTGERIKAYVVLKKGETTTEKELIEYCREHLAHYKVPSQVEFRDSLPKSVIGKVLRKALREQENLINRNQ